jgi:hypothetical protein
MRKRARNDQAAGKAADRRKAEDAVADAEATLVEARDAFDKVALAKRAGGGSDADIGRTRRRQDQVGRRRRSPRRCLFCGPRRSEHRGMLLWAREQDSVAFRPNFRLTRGGCGAGGGCGGGGWFLVPLFVINQAVERIKDGTITNYRYDLKTASLMPVAN